MVLAVEVKEILLKGLKQVDDMVALKSGLIHFHKKPGFIFIELWNESRLFVYTRQVFYH